jgi:hypothetical protein
LLHHSQTPLLRGRHPEPTELPVPLAPSALMLPTTHMSFIEEEIA